MRSSAPSYTVLLSAEVRKGMFALVSSRLYIWLHEIVLDLIKKKKNLSLNAKKKLNYKNIKDNVGISKKKKKRLGIVKVLLSNKQH